MDWAEAAGALQLLSEERVGTRLREQAAREDAAAASIENELRGLR